MQLHTHTHTHTHTEHALFSFPHLEHSYSHLMEKEMATHSSVLAWKMSWTEETGRPPSVESQRVRHNWAYTHIHTWAHQCSIQTPDQQEPPSQPLSQPCRGWYLIRSLHAHIPDHWWHRPWRVNPGASSPLRTVVLNQAWVFSQETLCLSLLNGGLGGGKGPAGIYCVEPGILLNILQCTSQPLMGQDWETLPCRIRGQLSWPQQLANKLLEADSSVTAGHGLYHRIPPLDTTVVGRERPPYRAPRAGSCLTLGNELSEETHVLTKQKILLGKGTRVESSRVREPRRTALLRGSQCRVLWWWD